MTTCSPNSDPSPSPSPIREPSPIPVTLPLNLQLAIAQGATCSPAFSALEPGATWVMRL